MSLENLRDKQIKKMRQNVSSIYTSGHSLQKSETTTLESTQVTESFEKGGKRAEIGEVRTWGKEQWVKHQDGWVHIHPKTGKATLERPGGKREPASDHHTSHHKEFMSKHESKSGEGKGNRTSKREFNNLSDAIKLSSNKYEIEDITNIETTPGGNFRIVIKGKDIGVNISKDSPAGTEAKKLQTSLFESRPSKKVSDDQSGQYKVGDIVRFRSSLGAIDTSEVLKVHSDGGIDVENSNGKVIKVSEKNIKGLAESQKTNFLNKDGVHKGYLSLMGGEKGFDRNSARKAGSFKEVRYFQGDTLKVNTESERDFLNSLKVYPVSEVGGDNPPGVDGKPYIYGNKGDLYLVDPQGYEYPRYIMELDKDSLKGTSSDKGKSNEESSSMELMSFGQNYKVSVSSKDNLKPTGQIKYHKGEPHLVFEGSNKKVLVPEEEKENFEKFLNSKNSKSNTENKKSPYTVKESNSNPLKKQLKTQGYSDSDIEDFLDEYEQGGNKLPLPVKGLIDEYHSDLKRVAEKYRKAKESYKELDSHEALLGHAGWNFNFSREELESALDSHGVERYKK